MSTCAAVWRPDHSGPGHWCPGPALRPLHLPAARLPPFLQQDSHEVQHWRGPGASPQLRPHVSMSWAVLACMHACMH